MENSIIVLSGVIIGTLFMGAGCILGAYLVRRTYEDITNPQPLLVKLPGGKDNTQNPREVEGYDWDSYDQYISRATDDEDDEGVPEA